MDKPTSDKIKLLHPAIAWEVEELINAANALISPNITIRVVQGLRTIEEQNELYAQGRTKPGKIVTKAKGGSSYHNYGMAIDFAFLVNGKEISWDTGKDWDGDHTADWMEVVSVFEMAGYEWGGMWKTIKDYPHLQKTFGYSEKQLLEKYNKKDFITGTRYINL
jgi:peptidoglycan L-alanyl-D-glutamate endopeptidase CwlK